MFSQKDTLVINSIKISINDKIFSHFGATYVNNLKENNPDLLLYLNFYVEHSYVIKNIGEKAKEYQANEISKHYIKSKKMSEVQVENNSSDFNVAYFNPFSYNIKLLDEKQVFPIGSDGFALVFYSKAEFIEMFNSYRKQFYKKV